MDHGVSISGYNDFYRCRNTDPKLAQTTESARTSGVDIWRYIECFAFALVQLLFRISGMEFVIFFFILLSYWWPDRFLRSGSFLFYGKTIWNVVIILAADHRSFSPTISTPRKPGRISFGFIMQSQVRGESLIPSSATSVADIRRKTNGLRRSIKETSCYSKK